MSNVVIAIGGASIKIAFVGPEFDTVRPRRA